MLGRRNTSSRGYDRPVDGIQYCHCDACSNDGKHVAFGVLGQALEPNDSRSLKGASNEFHMIIVL